MKILLIKFENDLILIDPPQFELEIIIFGLLKQHQKH